MHIIRGWNAGTKKKGHASKQCQPLSLGFRLCAYGKYEQTVRIRENMEASIFQVHHSVHVREGRSAEPKSDALTGKMYPDSTPTKDTRFL